MKKRVLSIILSSCLFVTMMPIQGMASEIKETSYEEPVSVVTEKMEEPETSEPVDKSEESEIIDHTEANEETEVAGKAEIIEETETAEDQEITEESELLESTQAEEVFLSGYIPLEEEEDTPSVLVDNAVKPFYELPASYITPNLNPVKKQIYGNCWAFSSMFLAEKCMEKFHRQEVQDYSELHLTYFSYHSVEDLLGGTIGDKNSYNDSVSFLDRGGNLLLAEKILAGWIGAANEELVPNETVEVVREQGLDEELAFRDQAHLQNSYHVNIQMDREEAKKLIYENGAISVSYYSKGKEKYYNDEYNSYYCPENITDDHAVAIVGWDDNFPASNFSGVSQTVPEGDGAWYVRNSWGTDEECYEGYFWLSYYDASLNKTAYSLVFEDSDNYDYNYQYDGSMASTNMGYGTEMLKMANVFHVKGGVFAESLKAVGFSTYNSNVNYKIEIYKNPIDASNPESGELQESATTEGRTSYQGYYTIPLEKQVILEKGDTFSVVITLSKEGENVLFVAEKAIDSWYICTANALSGQSFCKSAGTWKDYGQEKNANIRIKAYTDEVCRGEAEPVLVDTKVEINKYLESGETVQILETVGNPIRNIQIDSSYFYFEKDEEENWKIYLEPRLRSFIQKEKSFSQNLIVETEAGDYVFPIKIIVKVKKPSASVKCIEKLNVFYKDSCALYRLTGSADISSVSWKNSAENDVSVWIDTMFYEGGNEVVFSASGLNSGNYNELLKMENRRKGVLTVHFSGYTEEADQEIPITVGVSNVKPSLSLNPSQIKIYPSSGVTKGVVNLYNKSKKENVPLDDTYDVSCTEQDAVSIIDSSGRIVLDYTGKSSKKTLKVQINNNNWTQALSLSTQITAKKQPTISLEKTSVTLNKNVTSAHYAPIELSAYVADSDYTLLELVPDAKNAWIKNEVIKCEFDEKAQNLKVSLVKNEIKNSSKRITFLGTVETKEGIVLSGIPVSLVVSLNTGKVDLTITKKGNINLVERSMPVVYTPKVKRLTDIVEAVEISGKDANLFSAQLNELGKIEICAKENAALYAEKNYSATLVLTLKSGYVTEKNITIRPKQTNPKLSMPITSAVLYKRTGYRIDLPMEVAGNSKAEISRVDFVTSVYSDEFAVSTYANGKIAVMLRHGNSLKAGKYKLKFDVYLNGQAENRKPIKKTVTITVK